MKTSDFDFKLPSHLISQFPPIERSASRLMLLNRLNGRVEHRHVNELASVLQTESFLGASGKLPLMVFNNSKVRKARLIASSPVSGTKFDLLLLENQNDIWKTITDKMKRKKPGNEYIILDSESNEINRIRIITYEKETLYVKFDKQIDEDWLDTYGHIPLPPYIKRCDTSDDAVRYQTVYASVCGSAAAPTAGLHFSPELLKNLAASGIESAFVTLHVGMGTFLPVRSENITDHVMHEETFEINDETADKIEQAIAEGRKIIAVGTTSLRTLESAFTGKLSRGKSNTSIFIYPGYKFKIVNALFTNFHTPKSTLLMLVSAFAGELQNGNSNFGRDMILNAYKEAIKESYRFFSYGDAMLIY